MTKQFLVDQIRTKQSYLCVGLDTAIEKLPAGLPKNKEGVIGNFYAPRAIKSKRCKS